MAAPRQLKSVPHQSRPFCHQPHRPLASLLSAPSTTSVYILFSLHVFSCLRTICTMAGVMWLTPGFLPLLRLFCPLTQLHPSWLVAQEGAFKKYPCQCPLTWFSVAEQKIFHSLVAQGSPVFNDGPFWGISAKALQGAPLLSLLTRSQETRRCFHLERR